MKGSWPAGAGVSEWGHAEDISGYTGTKETGIKYWHWNPLDKMIPKGSKQNRKEQVPFPTPAFQSPSSVPYW